MSNLDDLIGLDTTLEEVARAVPVTLSDPERERHNIYANVLRAITVWAWNGNKYGAGEEYPFNPPLTSEYLTYSPYLRESYIGHNIAAIAVDERGRVIDFQFNHNQIFNSSVEHAESRLLRRVFSLRQLSDSWDLDGHRNEDKDYGTLLGGVTVYTTLESCSQCSGIMTLAGVKDVVFLQPDPGMYQIGYILRRLTKNDNGKTYLQAPRPISPFDIQLDGIDSLLKQFDDFNSQQSSKAGQPFARIAGDSKYKAYSITSFVCTQSAYDFFLLGCANLESLDRQYEIEKTGHPNWVPDGVEGALTNRQALAEAMDFYQYVKDKGYRGTPHRV